MPSRHAFSLKTCCSADHIWPAKQPAIAAAPLHSLPLPPPLCVPVCVASPTKPLTQALATTTDPHPRPSPITARATATAVEPTPFLPHSTHPTHATRLSPRRATRPLPLFISLSLAPPPPLPPPPQQQRARREAAPASRPPPQGSRTRRPRVPRAAPSEGSYKQLP
jgi:hypothetical protein